jgi:hypothetical protein
MKSDGSGRRKLTPERVLDVVTVSPDGHWIVAASPNPDQAHPVAIRAFAVDGSEAVTLCLDYCVFHWDTAGKFVYVYISQLHESSYALPVLHDSGLPKVSPGDIARIEHEANAKTITAIPGRALGRNSLPLRLQSPDHPPQPLSHPAAIVT